VSVAFLSIKLLYFAFFSGLLFGIIGGQNDEGEKYLMPILLNN